MSKILLGILSIIVLTGAVVATKTTTNDKKEEKSLTIDDYKFAIAQEEIRSEKVRDKMRDVVSAVRKPVRDTVIKEVPIYVDRIVEVEKEVLIHDTVTQKITTSVYKGYGYDQSNNVKKDTTYK